MVQDYRGDHLEELSDAAGQEAAIHPRGEHEATRANREDHQRSLRVRGRRRHALRRRRSYQS